MIILDGKLMYMFVELVLITKKHNKNLLALVLKVVSPMHCLFNIENAVILADLITEKEINLITWII